MLSKTEEQRINMMIALASEIGELVPEQGWTQHAVDMVDELESLYKNLEDAEVEGAAAGQVFSDTVNAGAEREDGMFEAFRDAWITTENGHKIHIGDDGDPDKGNPNVLNAIIKGAIDQKETAEAKEKAEKENRAKHPRKGAMVCEGRVSYGEKAGSTSKDKYGRTVTHFDHDEETMKITSDIPVSDGAGGSRYKIKNGSTIEHLTVFAAEGVGRGLDAAKGLAEQVGGDPASWKHSKGIGTVVGKDGVERKADIHWFESQEAGQLEWKIKYFLEDMDESQIYW